MTDWRTIRIPEADFERHNARRQKLGLTWAEYIGGRAPEMKIDVASGRLFVDGEAIDVDKQTFEQGVNYDRIREVVREEVRDALSEVVR